MTLGQIIKQYREDHGLSMSEFADLAGMSKSYVNVLEKGIHPKTGKPVIPSAEKVKAAADAMGVSISHLRAKIEPLDWSAEINDVEPTQEDLDLDLELWRERQESIGDVPHIVEMRKTMQEMNEETRKRLLAYAKYLLKEQKGEL